MLEGKAQKTENSNHLREVAISKEYSCNCEIKSIHESSVKNSQTCVRNESHYIIGIQLESLLMAGPAARLKFSSVKPVLGPVGSLEES